MLRSDFVRPGGKLHFISAALLRNRAQRMIEYTDECVHPAMYVAADRQQNLFLVERLGRFAALGRLTLIEGRVDFSPGVDVMGGVVAVGDLQGLPYLNREGVRDVVAA